MTYSAALDVSLRSTHACVIDEAGDIVAEGKVDSEAADIVAFDPKVRPLIETDRALRESLLPVLDARLVLYRTFRELDNRSRKAAHADPVCQRLMPAPGVGFVTALTFKAAVDDPTRFKRSRTVAAHCGLTPRRSQSGELDLDGHISRCGDAGVRSSLSLEDSPSSSTECGSMTPSSDGVRSQPGRKSRLGPPQKKRPDVDVVRIKPKMTAVL